MVVVRAGGNAVEISAGETYNWQGTGASTMTVSESEQAISVLVVGRERHDRQELSRLAMIADADEDRLLVTEWDAATPRLTE